MISELQETSEEVYARNATAIAQPQGIDFSQGVKVGKTIPAKWWNWLFNRLFNRFNGVYVDSSRMFAELKNTVTEAGLTPNANDNTQMAQAATVFAQRGIEDYLQNTKHGYFAKWFSEKCAGLAGWSTAADDVEIVKLAKVAGSESSYYLVLYKHSFDGTFSNYSVHVSDDLLTWYTIRGGAEVTTCDVVKFNGRYYCLYSNATSSNYSFLYVSDNLVDWAVVRGFTETGATGLRITGSVLWMISASATGTSNRHSYYTTDGINWEDAGVIFHNLSGVEDSISPVYNYKGRFIIGNKISSDGLTWQQITDEWANTAYSKVFILNNTAVIQFNETEHAWYTLDSPSGAVVRREGTAVIRILGPDGMLLAAKVNSNNGAGYTTDGINFTALAFSYPVEENAGFFKVNDYYVIGKRKSQDLVNWTSFNLPAGATGAPEYTGVGNYVVLDNQFTYDAGNTWQEGLCGSQIFCEKPLHVTNEGTCMYFYKASGCFERRVTFNSTNRVLGTTLYLR